MSLWCQQQHQNDEFIPIINKRYMPIFIITVVVILCALIVDDDAAAYTTTTAPRI